MATTSELQNTEINDLRNYFKDNIRILSSIGQFSYILKIRADQYDVSLTLQLDESYPSKAPEIIITAPRLAPDQILVVQRLLQTYCETVLNQPMILLIYQRLLRWFDENHIQSLNINSNNTNQSANVGHLSPQPSTNSKNPVQQIHSSTSRCEETENELSKKNSMKTAEDVISRIEWDDRLDSRCFRVGYIDRFLGLQEKAFNEFDFKVDLSTISDRHSSILAIPKHRIQYFKYNNEIIWDKETRTDLMFGSTGNQETIYDVINRHDHLMENNHSFFRTSQDDTPIELEHDENIEESRPLPRYLTLTDGVHRPNFYLSIPLNDQNFLANAITYRDYLLSTYPTSFSSRTTTTDSKNFHLTLLTLHLETVTLFDQCVTVLKRLQEEIRYHCSYPDRICVDFQGIETFYDRTIFIKCQQNRRLENLRNLIVERFCEQIEKQRINGMFLAGNYAEFIPHVTLLKCKRKFSSICPQEMKKEMSFGRQTIDCLQFASIGRNDSDEQKSISIFKLDLS